MISAVASSTRSRTGASQDQLHSIQDENRSHSQVSVRMISKEDKHALQTELLNGDPDLGELVGRTQETRNWGGMIISIIVIILICASIVIVAVIVSEQSGIHLYPKFNFEDVFETNETSFHYHWISDTVYISRSDDNNIVQRDITTNESTVLLQNRTWNVQGASEFSVSPSGDFILLICHKEHLYSHSYSAIYKIYDIQEGKVITVLKPEGVKEKEPRLRYASWSPSKEKTSIVFVYQNNIYYQEDVRGSPRQITTSGKENLMFNGIPDVAFSEELKANDAIYWFGRGGRFVYAAFNDTDVDMAWVPTYDFLETPEVNYFPYPKPGGKLPVVTLHVANLETNETVELMPPTSLLDKDHFYKFVVWVDESTVSVTWLNRTQDYAVVSICDADSGTCTESISYEATSGWVVLKDAPMFAADGTSYALVWELYDKDALDSHYHVHVVEIKDGDDEITNWTEGKFEVFKIVAYFSEQKTVYYLANSEWQPWRRHLYRVTYGRASECLSCGVQKFDPWDELDDPDDCACYYDAEFLDGSSKYILYYQGPGPHMATLHDVDEESYTVLEDNEAFNKSVLSRVHLVQESHVFEVYNKMMPVKILQQNKKDPQRKHPLLINIMTEPESTLVTSTFYQGWFTYLASQYHVITAHIDIRGSAGYGKNHLHAINKQLGTMEVEDLISVTEFLRNSSLGVVSFNNTKFDQDRVALIGQGYGGFLATMAYARSNFFNCSVAVSPITDWRHYNAILTEKYMDMPTPEDNIQGYADANLSSLAHLFRNNTFLMAHGMADKTVLFQNSANLAKALAEENIQFSTLFYPDQDHELWTSNVKMNLYQSLTDFLVNCLGLDELEST